ncbi:MAG: type II toxin-antitoxin system HicB family antitoxin [Sneathiellaceae bacterium]
MTNVMHYKNYSARIEFDSEDQILVGHLAGIGDIVGFHAENVADLQTAFHEAVDDYIATCEKIGKIPQKPYSGRMMFRVSPEVHRKAALAAELSGKSLNQWAEEALARAASDQYPAAS